MVQTTYPGVYIQEVPSGVRTITSVATSITAFIDFFREGPMNKAVEIFGMTDFARVFGGLDDRSEASYAISQFFLNGGGTALAVRVASKDATHKLEKAGVILRQDASAAVKVLEITAANEGRWGNNLRVEVDYGTNDPTKLFNLSVTRYDGPGPKAKAVASERFVNLTMDSEKPRYAVNVINDESRLIHAAKGAGASASTVPAACGTVSGDLSGLAQADFDNMSGKSISVKIGDLGPKDATLEAWGNTPPNQAVKSLRELRPFLERAIRAANPSSASFAGVTVEVMGNPDRGLRILSGRNSDTYDPSERIVIADSGTDSTATKLGLVAAKNRNVQEYSLGLSTSIPPASIAALEKLTTGDDGNVPGAAELVGGLSALDTVDLFNILCIPRTTKVTDDAELTATVSNAIKYCEDHRAFFILDIPDTIKDTQRIRDWLDAHNFRKKNAAVYFPLPRIPDPNNEFRLRSVGASGTLAGVYASTDAARGVWKAPAGIEAQLNGVSEFDLKLTDAQNGALNPLGINCLRSFPIYGNIAWGGRTLEGADQIGSEWKYIPIRRLALMLEESLFRGTKWVVFEPNDEPLWAKIRLNVGAYMTSLFRQGAFQGASPREAFYVKCDAETTTQDDRNKGIVNIEVGFAPLKPAEFVVIKIQQMAGEL
jgi:phage tail sheath protein FI